MEWNETLVLVGIGAVLIWAIEDTRQRTKRLEMRQRRLTVTFHRILVDIDLLHRTNLLIWSEDPEKGKDLSFVHEQRTKILRGVVEDLGTAADILSGLEFPDFDEDKVFWEGDIVDRFGLNSSPIPTVADNDEKR